MKKSPLSQFQESPKNFNPNYHGNSSWRNNNRHYNWRPNGASKESDDFQSPDSSFESCSSNTRNSSPYGLMTSTPTFMNNRGKRHFNNRNFQSDFRHNNHRRGGFRGSPYSPYQKSNSNFQHHRSEKSYRDMNVAEMFNLQDILRNPWEELERQNVNSEPAFETDSSAELISQTSSKIVDSTDEDGSLHNHQNKESQDNSVEESKEGSSIDLKIENIHFGNSSRESNPEVTCATSCE